MAHKARNYDVLVVGAGLAGLSAARSLVQEGKKVLVLEARDRVGGRTYSTEHHGVLIEEGAAWVGPTQNRVLDLARELDIPVFQQHTAGRNVYLAGSVRKTHGNKLFGILPLGSVPPDPAVLPDLAWVSQRLNFLARKVPVDAPWAAPNALKWDAITLAEWLRKNTINKRTAQLAAASFEALWGAEARDISLLFALHYVACAGDETHFGSFERLINDRHGAQDSRLQLGTQSLSIALANSLGDCLVFNSPVEKISQDNNQVTKQCVGKAYKAAYAVVAVPPPVRAKLDLLPESPLVDSMVPVCPPMGAIVKVIAIYDKPFWRKQGLNGQAVLDRGLVKTIFDVSTLDGTKGALLGFIGGDGARQWKHLSVFRQKREVLDTFYKCFGDEARNPIELLSHDWTEEPYAGNGGPTCTPAPGWITQFGAQYCEPRGRVHFAGTEMPGFWTGYMEGAIRSGERAARKVIALN